LIWWALEGNMTKDMDAVMNWLQNDGLWEKPVFTEHLAGRIAARLAAERGDTPSFTRINPYDNWIEYAYHPRNRMPGGKGDYTDWVNNYSADISKKNLGRLAELFEMAKTPAMREALLAGAVEGLELGPHVEYVPEPLAKVIGKWWDEGPQKESLLHTAALLRNSEWVAGQEELLVRIVLNGLKGDLVMPPMNTLEDGELADILTYIRGAWGHNAGPVSPGLIRLVREVSKRNNGILTRDELSGLRNSVRDE